MCAAFGDPPELYYMSRPIPPAWLVTDGVPARRRRHRRASPALGVARRRADAFATALGDALAAITPGDPFPRTEWEVVDAIRSP